MGVRMNQKDYKAIAEVIKGFYNWSRLRQKWIKGLANRFADYLEKEERRIEIVCPDINCSCNKIMFNREQFIKDCGVGE